MLIKSQALASYDTLGIWCNVEIWCQAAKNVMIQI